MLGLQFRRDVPSGDFAWGASKLSKVEVGSHESGGVTFRVNLEREEAPKAPRVT